MRPTISEFQQIIWDYYEQFGRHDLPWRKPTKDGSFDPYHILVSEIMLQQTQVSRVIPKFVDFIGCFPSALHLAQAPLSEVLTKWSGLGYNRRAKFLWQAAKMIADDHKGQIPRSQAALTSLPGVGVNTAGAIMAYSFNAPVIFIETNIRTVFIHHFFKDETHISDKHLMPLLNEALPAGRSREWYWALMDYGSYLKQTVGNVSRASMVYNKQSAFKGSRRQIRGQILKLLTVQPLELAVIQANIVDSRLESVLKDLLSEGFLEQTGSYYKLAS